MLGQSVTFPKPKPLTEHLVTKRQSLRESRVSRPGRVSGWGQREGREESDEGIPGGDVTTWGNGCRNATIWKLPQRPGGQTPEANAGKLPGLGEVGVLADPGVHGNASGNTRVDGAGGTELGDGAGHGGGSLGIRSHAGAFLTEKQQAAFR